MNPEHKERTAFSCWMGLFQFIKVPFGLCGAPTTFMRAMNELKKYISASFLIYIDDVILSSENELEHLNDIEQFLNVISNFGMRLKLEKCEFGLAEIKYLGFFISENGIRPDPKDLECINKIKPPNNLHELRAFLGAVNYFRKFIPSCAKILGPLYELTKDNKFKTSTEWNEEEWNSFNEIKEKLKSPPVLAPPNPKESYIIETDASLKGIGAVLIQNKHPVAYYSRTLKDTEKRYHINELEALAISQALKEFSIYIIGTGTTIIKTDNSPICSILTRKDLTGRLAKFQLSIQAYDIKIIHRSGKTNKFADYLSRNINVVTRSQAKANYLSSSESDEEQSDNNLNTNNNKQISISKTIKLQKMCPELRKIINALNGYFPQNKSEKELLEELIKSYSIINGALHFIDLKGVARLVIPYIMRENILKIIHDNPGEGGHLGINKTLQKMKLRFYWPNMNEDIKNYIISCESCQKVKDAFHPNHEELYPIKKPSIPFEHLHMDVIGPLITSTKGYKYILSIIDSFSKYLICCPLKDQTAPSIMRIIIDQIITKYGVPKYITSDQGRNFTSQIMKDISKIFGFEQIFTVSYHQSANGQVERSNRIIKSILAHYVNKEGRNWQEYLQLATMAYNSSKQESTKYSPFYILYGREMKLPIDRVLEIGENEHNNTEITLFQENLENKLNNIWKQTKINIEKAQEKQKENFDLKANPSNFKVGDYVIKKVEVPIINFQKNMTVPFK
uniref:RNA-directed DNA polymerase n=1 Tax=Meloidogyne enterolobii TaxID=390850 RepID=A0A6V7Y6Z8_MELEN|nr:unnamed protein product [Meloidogyne enterolobii]